jgi:hypothetical protein
MKMFDNTWLKSSVIDYLKKQSSTGFYDGTPRTYTYATSCQGFHLSSGTTLMFTRDQGMHSCGWWKNPDYERCWHLSLSFHDPISRESKPKDSKLTQEWIELFFSSYKNMLWCEPPFSDTGKQLDVWHYRLFCGQFWQPIIPRKEVYTTENTEPTWKSWSELNQPEMDGIE